MQLPTRPNPEARGRVPVRGDVVRTQIVQTAYRLFVDRGFADVSIEQIADAARISRRTVYNKFLNKSGIYRAAFEPVLAELELAAMFEVPPFDDARQVLHYHAATIRDLLDRPELIDMLRVLVHEAQKQRWLAHAYVTRFRIPIRSRFRDDMTRLIAAGRLPPRDVSLLTDQFFATTLGLLIFPRLLRLEAGTSPEASDALLRASVDGLLASWGVAH
jgi:TetR/AcrR family transcriptional regulator, regulator of autoinduction and epiphytic fitness